MQYKKVYFFAAFYPIVAVDLRGIKGSRYKMSFFSGPATKRGVGGEVRAWPLRKKKFLENSGKKFVATNLGGALS